MKRRSINERGNPTRVPCQEGNYSSRGGTDPMADKGDWEVHVGHGTFKPSLDDGVAVFGDGVEQLGEHSTTQKYHPR